MPSPYYARIAEILGGSDSLQDAAWHLASFFEERDAYFVRSGFLMAVHAAGRPISKAPPRPLRAKVTTVNGE